jgi:diguanylate cyclase (GGDEF)-like protein
MKNITSSLGFRLTVASYLVVAVFMSVAGVTVYRVSKDSIKMGATSMVRQMADDLQLGAAANRSPAELGDVLARRKAAKSGSAWIMDRDGTLLYNPDPLFREEYLAKNPKAFGNIIVSLQSASPRAPTQGGFREKLADIAQRYDEGFGTYRQFGEERIVAFRSLPGRGLLIGVDEPVTSANSELDRIKKFISYTALVSALLIMAFNLLSIRIIIRPYYHELEDLNASLEHSNRQLEDINAKLAVSNRNLTVLYEVGLGMRHTLALRDILDLILKGAVGVLDVDRIAVFVPAAGGRELVLRAVVGGAAGGPGRDDVRVPLGPTGGALAAAFQRKETVRIEEGQRIPPSLRLADPLAAAALLRSRAFVAVPLVVQDRAVGVIVVDNKVRRGPLSEDMVHLLGIFANQAAVAVENARLYDQLRRKIEELDARVDQLSIMHQIGNAMQRIITREEALGFIMRGIFEGIGFSEVVLALVDREEDALRGETGLGVAVADVRGVRVPLVEEENLLVLAASRKSPVGIVHLGRERLLEIVSQPLEDGAWRESVGVAVEGARVAVMAVPLIAREEVIGVVAVARREPAPVVRRNEVELLLLYANTAGLTVERSELYDRLQHSVESLEVTDNVSRLFTFRYGQQRLHEELATCLAAREPFAAVMIGVDGFKAYNDGCGHEAGDRALAEIGEIVKGALRGTDVAFRYGGRLLAAGMPRVERAAAAAVAAQIRERVRRHRFPGAGGQRDQALTVTIGVAGCAAGQACGSVDDIFKSLLGQLHRDEAGGGDRIFTIEG